jgi:hypothetical protein
MWGGMCWRLGLGRESSKFNRTAEHKNWEMASFFECPFDSGILLSHPYCPVISAPLHLRVGATFIQEKRCETRCVENMRTRRQDRPTVHENKKSGGYP